MVICQKVKALAFRKVLRGAGLIFICMDYDSVKLDVDGLCVRETVVIITLEARGA